MLSQFRLSLFLLLCALLTTSCVTPLPTQAGVPEMSASDYENALLNKTRKIEVYEGLYNILTVQATWLDSQMTEATLSQSARNAQWNEPLYREERAKKVLKNTDTTEFFVSMYTPERRHSDLSKTKNLWKIYLEVDGQRYEGKATKVKLLLSEIQALYGYHNRWSVPYLVSFQVPTATVENRAATLTFTGAVGAAQLKF